MKDNLGKYCFKHKYIRLIQVRTCLQLLTLVYWEMKKGQARCNHASSTGHAHTSNTSTAQDTIDCDVI